MTAVLALTGWAVIATCGCLAMHRARRAATPTPPPPVAWTDWTLSQPPVPTQAEVDECWLSAWPTDVERTDIDHLEQQVFDRLFDDIVAIGGLES